MLIIIVFFFEQHWRATGMSFADDINFFLSTILLDLPFFVIFPLLKHG